MPPVFSFFFRLMHKVFFSCICHLFCYLTVLLHFFKQCKGLKSGQIRQWICDLCLAGICTGICTSANTSDWFNVIRTHSSVRNGELEELPVCVVSHRRVTHVCPCSPLPVHTLLVLCHISLVLVKRRLPGLFSWAVQLSGREKVEIKWNLLDKQRHTENLNRSQTAIT